MSQKAEKCKIRVGKVKCYIHRKYRNLLIYIMKIWGISSGMDLRVLDQENTNGVFQLNRIN